MKHCYLNKLLVAMLLVLCSMSAKAYFVCDMIKYEILSEEDKTVEITGTTTRRFVDVVLPSTVVYEDVTYTVTSIKEGAFKICTGLTSITVPGSITSIGNNAFENCSKLTDVILENGVASIGDGVFNNCFRLAAVTIPSSVTSIGNRAFYGCSALKEIEIPSGVASIGNGAFYDCSALERIVVAEGNSVYDSRGNCNAIINTETGFLAVGCKNTVIPDDIAGIGNGAFYNCTDLTSVVLPDGVIYIGEESFNGCSALRSIEIPNSIAYFGISAFYGCNALERIVIAEGEGKYDSRGNCNAVIETATNTLIAGCKGTVIPDDVTNIGTYAFYNCITLKKVTIPKEVAKIGYKAFYGCDSLTYVTSYMPLDAIMNTANTYDLTGIPQECVFNVPFGSANAYRYVFSNLNNYVEMEATADELDCLYNSVLEYGSDILDDTTFLSHGLVKDFTQLGTNAQEEFEGAISNLVDSDTQTFFHSTWSSATDSKYHYLQIDFNERIDAFELKLCQRDPLRTSTDGSPVYVDIYAVNDVDCEWTKVGTYFIGYNFLTDSIPTAHLTVVMDDDYRYVRMVVKRTGSMHTSNGNLYFNLSELGAWKLKFNASHAVYSGVPAELMNELSAAMAEAKEKLAARDNSEATFRRLKKAFGDVVNYDPTGIQDVAAESAVAEGVYDLYGRRVENRTKGIYIVNGKKVFVK